MILMWNIKQFFEQCMWHKTSLCFFLPSCYTHLKGEKSSTHIVLNTYIAGRHISFYIPT